MVQFHKYSVTELENMIPWERDVYVMLLQHHLEEEKQKMDKLEAQRKNKQSLAMAKKR